MLYLGGRDNMINVNVYSYGTAYASNITQVDSDTLTSWGKRGTVTSCEVHSSGS